MKFMKKQKMSNRKFSKAPLSDVIKEKKADEFLNYSSKHDIKYEEENKIRVFKKEPIKPLALRFPISLANDISEISAITGLSVNAICIELLRPSVKQKLKELKE